MAPRCRFRFGVALLPGVLATLLSAVEVDAAAGLSLTPSSGHRGDKVTATGSGFPVDGPVVLTWEGQAWTQALAQKGTFTVSSTVPNYAVNGANTVQATSTTDRTTASATFTIVTPPPSPTPQPPPPPPPPQTSHPSPSPSEQASPTPEQTPTPEAASPSPSPAPPLTVTLNLTWTGGGSRTTLGPLTCTGQDCAGTGSIPAGDCGGQSCEATATCQFTAPGQGTCAVDISPCGQRASCSTSGNFVCERDRCDAALALGIAQAKAAQFPWWLLALGLLGLVLAVAWLNRRRLPRRWSLYPPVVVGPPAPGAGAAAGPVATQPAGAPSAGPGTTVAGPSVGLGGGTRRCRCESLHLYVEEWGHPDCKAIINQSGGWVSPGLTFTGNVKIFMRAMPAPGSIAGSVLLSGKGHIGRWNLVLDGKVWTKENDIDNGMTEEEYRRLPTDLQVDIVGTNPLNFACECRDTPSPDEPSCDRSLDFSATLHFSDALKQFLLNSKRRLPVRVIAAIDADATAGECHAHKDRVFGFLLELDASTGKVILKEHPDRRF